MQDKYMVKKVGGIYTHIEEDMVLLCVALTTGKWKDHGEFYILHKLKTQHSTLRAGVLIASSRHTSVILEDVGQITKLAWTEVRELEKITVSLQPLIMQKAIRVVFKDEHSLTLYGFTN